MNRVGFIIMLVVCSSLVGGGCVSRSVVVLDAGGTPVSGAKVEPVSLSINYGASITGGSGKVALPRVTQTIEWVSVTKQGFQPSGHVPVWEKRQTVIVLKKSGGS
jgi:hypothetical protein